ncbi:SDR family NAD(P)-dependent oxidoreductase [Metabacillus arenae]|nr:SDR family oxidoreductase [Metabacillus arenae]
MDILKGKVAVVTGAGSGIGYAIAKRFIEEGANVVAADISESVAGLKSEFGESVLPTKTDVTNEEDVVSMIKQGTDHFGKIDIMCNNAGSTGDSSAITDISKDGFDKTFALDTRSVLYGHKHAARQFREQGTGGSIITMASVAALQGGWSSVSYTTAKHAVVGIIRHAAKELGTYGIRSNGIAPGVIMTPLIAKAFGVPQQKAEELNKYIDEHLGSEQALRRYGKPEDIANTALFLASDLSAYVNGVVIPVDGGISSYTLSTSDADITEVAKKFLENS